MNELFTIAPWLGGILLILLGYACFKSSFRTLAMPALVFSVPLASLIALNNNHANAVSNFLMGIALFGIPLIVHAGFVLYLNSKRESQ